MTERPSRRSGSGLSAGWLDYPRFAMQLLNGWFADETIKMTRMREEDAALDLAPPWRVLDIGCGRLQPQAMTMQFMGHHVTGLDLANTPDRSPRGRAYALARRLLHHRLARCLHGSGSLSLIAGDATRLPFADGSFDFISSDAAFEHFPDVGAVLREAARVLRPGGVIWLGIHLFTSLSGAHNVGSAEIPVTHLPRGVEPWDHLRCRERAWPVYLNQWRARDYRMAIPESLTMTSWRFYLREGEHLLTNAIREELAAYDEDELLHRALIIVARK